MRTPAELTTRFREQGRKITPQRVAIFEAMHGNGVHPTAEAIYSEVAARMPSISRRTVYQTLNDLSEMGEIRSLCLGPGAARFDPNTDDHHHLVCDGCGAVVDTYIDVSGLRADGGVRGGFQVARATVILHGRCTRCPAPPDGVGGGGAGT